MDTEKVFSYNPNQVLPLTYRIPPCFGRFAMNRPFFLRFSSSSGVIGDRYQRFRSYSQPESFIQSLCRPPFDRGLSSS